MASSSSTSNIKQDLAFLIVQLLDEHNFTETARTLEREGKILFNMKYVEESVINGKWKELEDYVLNFTKIDENSWSTKMIFEIRRRKYIEALDNGQYTTALEILTNELQTIVDNEDAYNEIARFMLNDVSDNEKLRKYYADTAVTPRRSIFTYLKMMIELNPVLKDKLKYPIMEDSRLKRLMNHSINWQHSLCKYPDANPTISTLYHDHTCGDAVCLSLNDEDCRDLGYLKTDEREKPIIPQISEQAQLLSLRLPDPKLSSKIDRLTYNHSGNAIFALSCSGVLKFWKWKVEETNAGGEATPRIMCEHAGFLDNDIGTGEHELVVPCFALSKNDSYVASASGGKVSLFGLRASEFLSLGASGFEIKKLTAFMSPPPAATSILFFPEDNDVIILGMEDGTIQVYDVKTDQVKAKIEANDQKSRVTGLAYSSALNILVSSTYNAEICSWRNFALMKQSSRFLDIDGRAVSPGRTCIKFHRNQKHMLVVHESCMATLEGPELKPCTQWISREQICDATYSCDGHTVYASFVRGHIAVLDSPSFTLRCIINPSAYITLNPSLVVSACAISAHPSKPNRLALGLSDGSVLTVEPQEGNWPGRPQLDNVCAT
ncbi:hypothetical protein POM88_039592 [Heracleum sosnowskyi]|uniref:CTLH domain-containing protein n=1 Tax=Heracleum sosnowskyi TaxID=360622 RepID=A0AAD8HCG9_9APIA|nr:hypothetical protein POM88_039592 [Heracleum sosnowskyi]